MPLSKKTYNNEVQAYFDDYLEKADNLGKHTLVSKVRRVINNAFRHGASDKDWLRIINFIATEADKAQQEGYNASNATEMLFMVLRVIRREISESAKQEKIAEELRNLEQQRRKYVADKKLNIDDKAIEQDKNNIDATIKRLAYLGHLQPLLELDLDEMKLLFKGNVRAPLPGTTLPLIGSWVASGYQYITDKTSYVLGYEYPATPSAHGCENLNPYLPYILQDEFEPYFLTKNYNGVRPEGSRKKSLHPSTSTTPTPSEIGSPLSVSDEKEIVSQILAAPITGIFDTPLVKPALSIKIPGPLSIEHKASDQLVSTQTIIQLQEYASYYTLAKVTKYHFDVRMKIKECNDIIKRIDEAAQSNASVNEWLDIIIALGKKADKVQNDGKFCSTFTEIFYLLLHTLRQEIARNAPDAYRERIRVQRDKLAASKKRAANAKINNKPIAQIEQIEQESYVLIQELAYLGDLDALLELSPEKLAKIYTGYAVPGLGQIWYEFSTANPKPYGVTKPICTKLPLVLDESFPLMFLNKHQQEINAEVDSKQAEEFVTKSIADLTAEISALMQDQTFVKINSPKHHDPKTLLNQIKEDDVLKLEEKIGSAEAFAEATRAYMTKNAVTLSNLTEALTVQIERIQALKITEPVMQVLRKEKERVAEEKAVEAIRNLTKALSQFCAEPATAKLVSAKDKEATYFAEEKRQFTNIKAVETRILAFEQTIEEIQVLIGQVNSERRAGLTNSLTAEIQKIESVKAATIQITATMKNVQPEKPAVEEAAPAADPSPRSAATTPRQSSSYAGMMTALSLTPRASNPASPPDTPSSQVEEVKKTVVLDNSARLEELLEKIINVRGVIDRNKAEALSKLRTKCKSDPSTIPTLLKELAAKSVDVTHFAKLTI